VQGAQPLGLTDHGHEFGASVHRRLGRHHEGLRFAGIEHADRRLVARQQLRGGAPVPEPGVGRTFQAEAEPSAAQRHAHDHRGWAWVAHGDQCTTGCAQRRHRNQQRLARLVARPQAEGDERDNPGERQR
jgi:hypothetical protein